MLDKLDWNFNCDWMSQLLSFEELNALSLTSKTASSCANGARMLKIKEWKNTANEGELVWIQHYEKNYPRIINPASLYLKCLRYRHICSNHFRDIVTRDPRLTYRQKSELIDMSLKTQPSKLFYWFVVDLLPRRPMRCNFSLSLLKKALHLPYGQEIIRKTSFGTIYVFLNNDNNIVISNDNGLLGVITEDNHLWMTPLWDCHCSRFVSMICSITPELILTGFSSTCPFCGVDVLFNCSHTMKCMENYAKWVGGIRDFSNVAILTK